jgi:hypothetical protein
MHRYDREHHRPTSNLREHHPGGWEQGHKTGWHNSSVPPQNTGSRRYERPTRGPAQNDVSMNARRGPVVR